MNSAYAQWVAAHALLLLILLPLAAAALAVGLARAYVQARPPARLAGFAGMVGLACAAFLSLAAAVSRPGGVVEFDSALADALLSLIHI